MDKKRCSKCRRVKDVSFFSKNSSMFDGLSHYCKKCNRERLAKYFATRKGKAAVKRATARRTAARRAGVRLLRKKN
ncbi:MAG: hypothetical protein AB1650_02745 [Candidatus Omnitrophota bacterium]